MAIITSTIGTTGRTYSTLQLWEDALPASAVTAGNSYVGECYNDSEFTGAGPLLTIAGTTTDSTHTITLKCGSGQSFYDNAGKLTNQLKYDASLGVGIRATSGFQVSTIEVGGQWVTLDGLQVSMGLSGGYSAVNVTVANCTIKNCIGYVSTGNNKAAFSNSTSATIVNNLAIQAGTVASNGFDLSGGGTFVACTAVRTTATGGTAFSRDYSTPLIKDCAGFGFNKFGKDTTGSAGSGYNCTDVASGNTPGTNNLFSKTFASQFIDITNTSAMDFRVKTAADLINAGTRDATNTADLDIIKSARSTTTPTIGAWEYASAGGGAAALAASVSAIATATGDLTTSINLAGSPTAISTASGNLTTSILFASSPTAQVTATGSLTTSIQLASNTTAQASSFGNMTTAIMMAGTASGLSSATASLSTSIALAGVSAATSTVTGNLTVGSAGLSGSMAAQASASGALTTAISMSGDATAQSTASGTMTGVAAALSGSCAAASSSTGILTTSIALAGASAAQASASAAMTTAIAMAAIAQAQATASASLTTGGISDPRYARPRSTVSPGAWVPSIGADLASMIDEPSADSTDFISTASSSTCEVRLGSVVDPSTSSGQVVRYQAWSPEGNALTVSLKQGTATIAVWTHASLPTSPTIYAQPLSPSECDSITDYTDLRFEFTAA